MQSDTQRCQRCGEEKEVGQFARNRATKLRSDECRTCRARRKARAHYYQHREDVLKAQAVYRSAQVAAGKPRSSWSKSPEKERAKHLKRTYGITPEEYDRMLEEQGGVCAVCHRPEDAIDSYGNPRRLSIDHDHRTGRVRALLCTRCNTALGQLGDDPKRILALLRYLRKHSATTP